MTAIRFTVPIRSRRPEGIAGDDWYEAWVIRYSKVVHLGVFSDFRAAYDEAKDVVARTRRDDTGLQIVKYSYDSDTRRFVSTVLETKINYEDCNETFDETLARLKREQVQERAERIHRQQMIAWQRAQRAYKSRPDVRAHRVILWVFTVAVGGLGFWMLYSAFKAAIILAMFGA